MTVRIGELRGVTPELEAKLRNMQIDDSDKLLENAHSSAARRELSAKLGIDAKDLLELANRADLIRLKGVAGAYSDLLENAGVDTVKELASRVPENLQARLAQVNSERKLARSTPTLAVVTAWVAEAKTLRTILEY